MPKLIKEYHARMVEQNIAGDIAGENIDHTGKEGKLSIMESVHKYPGMKFIVFESGEYTLQTSPGELSDDGKEVCITTRQKNVYRFEIISVPKIRKFQFQTPERFWHICEVCGKRELLDSETAYNAGWDYPPKMGKFGVLSPRTCGNCGIDQTLWFKITSGEVKPNTLSTEQKALLDRVTNEPLSLMPDKEE